MKQRSVAKKTKYEMDDSNVPFSWSRWLNKFFFFFFVSLGSAVLRNSRSSNKPYVSVFPLLSLSFSVSPPFFLSVFLFMCVFLSVSLFCSLLPWAYINLQQLSISASLLWQVVESRCRGGNKEEVEEEEEVERRRQQAEHAGDAAADTVETPPCAAFRCAS